MKYDAMRFFELLVGAGTPEPQAKAQIQMITELVESDLATKRDLKELEVNLKRDIKELEVNLKKDITIASYRSVALIAGVIFAMSKFGILSIQ